MSLTMQPMYEALRCYEFKTTLFLYVLHLVLGHSTDHDRTHLFAEQLSRSTCDLTKCRPLYLKSQSVPRSKHFSSRL